MNHIDLFFISFSLVLLVLDRVRFDSRVLTCTHLGLYSLLLHLGQTLPNPLHPLLSIQDLTQVIPNIAFAVLTECRPGTTAT